MGMSKCCKKVLQKEKKGLQYTWWGYIMGGMKLGRFLDVKITLIKRKKGLGD